MRKKILSLVLIACVLIPSVFVLGACQTKGDDSQKESVSTFTQLAKDKTLYVGSYGIFKNSQYSTTEECYLTYPVSAKLTLSRSYYKQNDYDIEYNGYWYRWSAPEYTETNVLLGNKTITTTKTYSYVTYGVENKDITVKTKTEVKTKFDFTPGQIQKITDIQYVLNDYFSSINDLMIECQELYKKVGIKTTNKYYVTTPKTTYTYTENTYTNTYFYFE